MDGEVRVIFIPKAGKGKPSHIYRPKNFRPISIPPFLLKNMEKIISNVQLIRDLPSFGILDIAKHTYCKSRWVETAIHEVVETIEESLYFNEHTLAALLDIEGAFNNLKTSSIENALVEFGVKGYLG